MPYYLEGTFPDVSDPPRWDCGSSEKDPRKKHMCFYCGRAQIFLAVPGQVNASVVLAVYLHLENVLPDLENAVNVNT